MTEVLKPSEVLSRAADLIEPEGKWVQHDYGLPGQPMCMVGALREAAVGWPYSDAYEIALRAVGSSGPLSAWNDAPDRTQAEVVAALRKAADLAREAGQ